MNTMSETISAHLRKENGACACGSMWWLILPSHAAHVADELTKAGYGMLPDFMHEYGAPPSGINGPAGPPVGHGYIRDPNFLTKSTHHRLVTPWQELAQENP